jgi:hypothetical protein
MAPLEERVRAAQQLPREQAVQFGYGLFDEVR